MRFKKYVIDFSLKHFWFCARKKKLLTLVQLTTVVEIRLLSHHLMRCSVLSFVGGACTVVRYGLASIDFSFFSFPSLSSSDYVLAMQKIIPALLFFFSFDSVILLLIAFNLFTLIISN
jgi:hypothetical protein